MGAKSIGGQISKSNGDVYEGEWKNGYFNGYGRLIGRKMKFPSVERPAYSSNIDYFMGPYPSLQPIIQGPMVTWGGGSGAGGTPFFNGSSRGAPAGGTSKKIILFKQIF